MGIKHSPGKPLDDAMSELEELAEEIRLKLHLAGMDAKAKWNDVLEPKLFEARTYAREATDASRKSVEDVVQALRAFAKTL